MRTFKQKYLINASIEKVWQALTDPKIIDDWGGGPAKMSEEEGYEFSLWGGDIFGKNIKVIKNEQGSSTNETKVSSTNKKLVQDWTAGNWDQPSRVTFTLTEKSGKTEVDLLHENVPDNEADEIGDGWKRYYLGPLKEMLEKV